MKTVDPPREIPAAWIKFFRLEIPLVAATIVFWLAFPERYLARMFGSAAPDIGQRYLLLQGASVTASMFLWFYGRVLFSASPDRRTFRYLQEAMALGDVGILALSAYLASASHPDPAMLAAQVILAAFWGTSRVFFLVRQA